MLLKESKGKKKGTGRMKQKVPAYLNNNDHKIFKADLQKWKLCVQSQWEGAKTENQMGKIRLKRTLVGALKRVI